MRILNNYGVFMPYKLIHTVSVRLKIYDKNFTRETFQSTLSHI